jgi:hypothetical protein
MQALVLFDPGRTGPLWDLLEGIGCKLDTVDLVVGEFNCRIVTWQPPAAPKLQQLLEQAAVIAAREDSPAGKYIKQALEALRIHTGTTTDLAEVPTEEGLREAFTPKTHRQQQRENEQSMAAARTKAVQDKTRDP